MVQGNPDRKRERSPKRWIDITAQILQTSFETIILDAYDRDKWKSIIKNAINMS